jgi:hypothetical protein
MKRLFRIAFSLSLIAPLSSCSWLHETFGTSKVTLHLPAKIMSSATVRASSHIEGGWGLQAPGDLGSVDCYGIYMFASDFEAGSCSVAANGNEQTLESGSIPLSRLYGLFPAGSQISLETKPGRARTIGVFAFKSENGNCTVAPTANFNPAAYSQPLLVGSVTMDLVSGDNQATIEAKMTGSTAIGSCRSSYFSNLANQTWPAGCSPSVKSMAYNNSQITISGSCLDRTTQVSIRDNTTSELFALSLASATNTLVTAGLQSSFSMIAGRNYSLLISTAHAQTAVPLTLTLGDNSVPLSALVTTGSSAGQVLTIDQATSKPAWKTLSASGGEFMTPLFFKDGPKTVGRLTAIEESLDENFRSFSITSSLSLINFSWYYNIRYAQIGGQGPAYLVHDYNGTNVFFPFNPNVPEAAARYPIDGPYFSNPDCTGDIYFKTWSGARPIEASTFFTRKVFPVLTGCSGSPGSCSGLSYKKLALENMTVVSYQSPPPFQSKIMFDAKRADVGTMFGFYCGSSEEYGGGSGSAYKLINNVSNVTTPSSTDLPGIIQDPQVGY